MHNIKSCFKYQNIKTYHNKLKMILYTYIVFKIRYIIQNIYIQESPALCLIKREGVHVTHMHVRIYIITIYSVLKYYKLIN